VIEYIGLGNGSSISGAGWLWGHHPHQVLVQFLAALTIIIWDGLVTFLIWMFIKYVLRMKLRFSDAELEIGDIAIHGEEAYPQEDALSTRLSVTAEAEASPSTEERVSAKE
jgi:ammonium transporter, Amt family